MNDHVLMFGFLYPFFSDKNNGLLLYLYTAYFSCESEFALCAERIQFVEKKKSNVILVMFFCNNFYTLVFLSFNLSSSFLFLISYFPFFFSHRDKLFSNTQFYSKSNSQKRFFLTISFKHVKQYMLVLFNNFFFHFLDNF